MRIGIFGGTFNPIHTGHLIVAQEVKEKCSLDKIFFIPAFSPPHKPGKEISNSLHRLAMVSLAIEGRPGFEVSDMEIRRGGSSYSIDTVKDISEQFPNSELFFIIGRDTLGELPTWKEIHKLLEIVSFITVTRSGQKEAEIDGFRGFFNQRERTKLKEGILSTPPIGISSTLVREKVRKGLSITWLVPEKVEMYILKNKLYL